MNYEQKYKEALKRARNMHEQGMSAERLEYVFPELRESEDEKIRKALIDYFDDANKVDENPLQSYGIHTDKAIAWLEKQGRQKPSDKIEPKFKIGDWITNGEYTWKVIDIKPLDYLLQSQNGDVVDDTISYVDEEFHLWTIQDANDGDVLYSHDKNLLWIYKDTTTYYASMILDYVQYDCISTNRDIVIPLDTCPATKEQCDLLFQKMKEAGYVWYAEKKELMKIEQNSVWSEEDERIYNEILDFFLGDIETRCATIDKQRHFGYWLKSIKDRVHSKQELSEEDEKKINGLVKGLEDRMGFGWANQPFTREEYIEWLKALKDRIQQQLHWKPSEEQMEALNAINNVGELSYDGQADLLIRLYNDLKKL